MFLRQPILAFAASLALALPALGYPGADKAKDTSIVAVKQNGRTVYVNADRPVPGAKHRHSVLVYWSNTERRWKPVPPPSPSVMAKARTAAAEVANFVVNRPRGSSRSTNPNYTRLARGYRVSTREIDTAITEAARKHGVNANLVRAIIQQESNFNPSAVSNKGAMGLMQLMPGTARSLGVTDPFDPEQNVDAGVRHLKHLLDNFNGDVGLSLAAYNAGQGAVQRNGGVPPFAETRNYVRRITSLYGKGDLATQWSGPIRAPIHVTRDERGVLTFTNTE